jgi:hypothetical protein
MQLGWNDIVFAFALGFIFRPGIERMWNKLNDKLDEWAGF